MPRANLSGPVLVAMSGGVDSSVVAGLLARRGHEVIGVTMQIWQESQTDPRHAGCCSLGAVEDARRVAARLGIAHYVVNFKNEFRDSVIANFIDEYEAGRTPNPCVQCNKAVKFELLMEKMRDFGCSTLATGHYARVRLDQSSNRYRLMKSRSGSKDQSYVLYMLSQEQLAVTRFPLGELPGKTETRRLASEMGLSVANKPDSQEICFVSEAGGYAEFLRKVKPSTARPGEIVDADGIVLGTHLGVAGFTIGQRRGIGVTAKDGRPLFVIRLEPISNRVVVGSGDDLLERQVTLSPVNWSKAVTDSIRVKAKIRYNMEAAPAVLTPGPITRLTFDEPVRAVTPGQIAVAYQGATVVAGGIIAAS